VIRSTVTCCPNEGGVACVTVRTEPEVPFIFACQKSTFIPPGSPDQAACRSRSCRAVWIGPVARLDFIQFRFGLKAPDAAVLKKSLRWRAEPQQIRRKKGKHTGFGKNQPAGVCIFATADPSVKPIDRTQGRAATSVLESNMTNRFLTVSAALGCLFVAACGGGGSAAPVADTPGAAAGGMRSQVLLSTSSNALTPAPAGLSGNVTCLNMQIDAIAVDSVIVPANAACTLVGTRLNGNIIVGAGATLYALAVNVTGSLQAEGAAYVSLAGGTLVGGSVQIKQGGSARVDGIRIGGNLQIDAMRGQVVTTANRLGGSMQLVGNLGGVAVDGNTMVGNLQCKENLPAPVANNNQAALIEDQCVPVAGGGGGANGGTVPPAGPLSGNVTCVGLRIGAIALDSVIVPEGATCVLEGTRLNGSIQVGARGQLSATDVQVTGGLQADGAAHTHLGGASSIGAGVQIKQGGSADVGGAVIRGDLQIDAMSGPVSASGNQLVGNLQVMSNRGGVALIANRLGGALQCKDNLPAPTGSANVASIKEDQCLGL
jgi:hypothetical protein